jgi:hypothetical protein
MFVRVKWTPLYSTAGSYNYTTSYRGVAKTVLLGVLFENMWCAVFISFMSLLSKCHVHDTILFCINWALLHAAAHCWFPREHASSTAAIFSPIKTWVKKSPED